MSDVRACPVCRREMLEGYPHRHETPPRPDHNPMPRAPEKLNDLIAAVRREYRLELPARLHVQSVPGRLEPIGVSEYSAAAGGYVQTPATIKVSDTGPLGAPSWSPPAHRRFGGVAVWEDVWTVLESDYAIFPWAYAIERRLPAWCRRRHVTRPDLYVEHRGLPICPTIVRAVIVGDRLSIRQANDIGISSDAAEELLGLALRYVWRCVSDALNEIDLRRSA